MRHVENLAELNALLKRRFLYISVLMALVAVVLAARSYYLQVLHGGDFIVQAEQNRLQFEPLPPERGLIRARDGELLARNVVSRSLYLNPDLIPEADFPGLIDDLSQYIDIQPHHVERYHYLRAQKRRPQSAVLLRNALKRGELAYFAVNSHKFPQVEVRTELQRHYPLGAAFGHITGYVGAINADDARSIDSERYYRTNQIGKDGIERTLEPALHGYPGVQEIEVNGAGGIVRYLEVQPAQRGQDIELTIDAGLQLSASHAMSNKRGVLIASDPQSGDILAMVSAPSYDPNLFVGGIDKHSYRRLNEQKALFNRITLGSYPPASTIKPFFALAALNEDITHAQLTIMDMGYFKFDDDDLVYRTWKQSGHGLVNLRRSIVVSSDTYFYHLGYTMGIAKMKRYLELFGFGQVSGAELLHEQAPELPSNSWKRERYDTHWFRGDTINASIGQGFLLVNPMQLMQATNTLVNRGEYVGLRLVRAIGSQTQAVRRDSSKDLILKNNKHWYTVLEAMQGVMHDSEGTAKLSAVGSSYEILGKTGTAQVISMRHSQETLEDERYRDHALFIGAAPAHNPRIAVTVILENGGSGGAQAAPLARALMDQWLLRNPEYLIAASN